MPDYRMESVIKLYNEVRKKFQDWISALKSKYGSYLKKPNFYYIILVPVLAAVLFYLAMPQNYVSAFEIVVDGESAGIFVLSEELQNKYSGMENVRVVPKKAPKLSVSSIQKLDGLLSKNTMPSALAYEIKIAGYEGKRLVFPTREEADKVLKIFLDKYADKKTFEEESVTSVKLAENFKLEPLYTAVGTISADEALNIIQTGTDEKKVYKLQPGDNITLIAKKTGLSTDSILKANPQIIGREKRLQIGEELSLIVPKPLLTAEIFKSAVYDEKIPYDIKTIPTNEEYKTYRKVAVKGEAGLARVKAKVVEENGIVNDSRTSVEERTVISDPKTEEVVQGTLQVPPKKAIGSFISPVYSLRISSGYGSRGGTYHYGIDIPKPVGSDVMASDGGVVAEVGSNRYADTGLMIKINHENGYTTRYLHLSSINVKPGERVYQGQKIGASGNTGNSTGPHLHFEIYKNGSPLNPSTQIR